METASAPVSEDAGRDGGPQVPQQCRDQQSKKRKILGKHARVHRQEALHRRLTIKKFLSIAGAEPQSRALRLRSALSSHQTARPEVPHLGATTETSKAELRHAFVVPNGVFKETSGTSGREQRGHEGLLDEIGISSALLKEPGVHLRVLPEERYSSSGCTPRPRTRPPLTSSSLRYQLWWRELRSTASHVATTSAAVDLCAVERRQCRELPFIALPLAAVGTLLSNTPG